MSPVKSLAFLSSDNTKHAGPYEGSIAHLRSRLRAIIKANPWLAGSLKRDRGSLVIVHPTAQAVTDELCDSFIHVAPEGLHINLSMSPFDRRSVIAKSKCLIPSGTAAIGQKAAESPLVRLVVAPCMHADGSPATDSADFVVLFFLSHMVGGGPTYYRLYGMMSDGASVVSLIPERVECIGEPVIQLLGQDMNAWRRSSLKFTLRGNSWYHRKFSPPAHLCTLLVDHEKIDILKAEAEKKSTDHEQHVPFVSTNDILCSRYAQMVGARMLTMAMNLRGRLPGVVEDLAGNYEQHVGLNDSACASPARVRLFLIALRHDMHATTVESACGSTSDCDRKNSVARPSVQRFMKPLPKWWSFMKDRYCYVTNWASVHKDLVIPGCTEVCHGPAVDFEMLRKIVAHDTMYVYRARPGQVAISAVSKLFNAEDFLKSMPVKEYQELSS
jgi:hypothetical protein